MAKECNLSLRIVFNKDTANLFVSLNKLQHKPAQTELASSFPPHNYKQNSQASTQMKICNCHITTRLDLETDYTISTTNLGLYQMITVDGGRNGNSRETTRNELEHSHLCGCILHGHPVGPQPQVTLPPLDFLRRRLIEM
jgi:hypothetical protein